MHNEWERRIARAEKLGGQYSFASEILGFYAAILRFQARFYAEVEPTITPVNGTSGDAEPFTQPLPASLAEQFHEFLSVVEQNGPESLRISARELGEGGEESHLRLLASFWRGDGSVSARGSDDFFARAFLQPYAAALRVGSNLRWTGPAPFACPFCKRKPSVGILRPLGDGGLRSLVCSLCLAEWEFRRIVCPGCGEEDYKKLPVYTAEELKHVRAEACESCRTYIKTVDMTTGGLAEPLVDEMASIPLDVWVQEQGYAKLQRNVLQL
jgi:formate dehydrogenase accessory protein FdhE